MRKKKKRRRANWKKNKEYIKNEFVLFLIFINDYVLLNICNLQILYDTKNVWNENRKKHTITGILIWK